MDPQGLLMKQMKLHKFDQVCDNVVQLHDRNYDDHKVRMEDVHVHTDVIETKHDDGSVTAKPIVRMEVPKVGMLDLTDWSSKQLGSMLGVKWDKWFNLDLITGEEIEEEMRRRFGRTQTISRVRARRHEKGTPSSDGYVRAFLSPSYCPIDDVQIFELLNNQFRDRMDGMRFMDRGQGYHTDKASYYTLVKDPINMGEIDLHHPDERVRRYYEAAEAGGSLPDADWVYPGFQLRNSEVGYTAVGFFSFLFRLVCLNGAVVFSQRDHILRRIHRNISESQMIEEFRGAFDKLPGVWDDQNNKLKRLQEAAVDDVDQEIKNFLNRRSSGRFAEQVVRAYEEEPIPTRYGVLQALTRAAQHEEDLDRRQELEGFGGAYLARAA